MDETLVKSKDTFFPELDKLGNAGDEKVAYKVGNEAWLINIAPLNKDAKVWIEASFLLAKILYALLPEHFPQPIKLEFTMADAYDSYLSPDKEIKIPKIKVGALRRMELITGNPVEEFDQYREERADAENKIEALGVGYAAIDSAFHNFIIAKRGQDGRDKAVYMDSPNPYIRSKVPEPTVDIMTLRQAINKIPDESLRSQTLTDLAHYEEIVGKIVNNKS